MAPRLQSFGPSVQRFSANLFYRWRFDGGSRAGFVSGKSWQQEAQKCKGYQSDKVWLALEVCDE